MRFQRTFLLVAAALISAGCATTPQAPIALAPTSIGSEAGRIGIAMTPLPKVDTWFPGADCLLCIATASATNSALTTHARTLPYEDLPQLKKALAAQLRRKGADVLVIEDDLKLDSMPDSTEKSPNGTAKNFSSLQQAFKIDRLVVIEISQLGFTRNYAAYIPTSDPKAVLRGVGYLVNLKNNVYEWYHPVQVLKSADQVWDEPPNYPGLTNAYFQMLEISKDQFLQPFTPQTSGQAAVSR